MSVKLFRIRGEINKKHFFEPLLFNKIVSATKEKQAIEQIYTELGSRHRAKRYEINIISVTLEEQDD